MGRRGMPGRRRQVVQLDENMETSYLTQTGCYRPGDMFVESKVKTGLALVGEYSDSESDSEEEEMEQTDPDAEYKLNGDMQLGGEESQIVTEKNDSLQAEMLEIVGAKKETSADIFLREFQAYQKESTAPPVYNREFIAFQKETKEPEESTPTSSSSKDAPKESTAKPPDDVPSPATKTDKPSTSGPKAPDIDSQVASFLAEIDALGDDEEKVEDGNEAGSSDRSTSVDREQTESQTTSDSKDTKDTVNGNSTATGSSSKIAKEVEEKTSITIPPPPPKEEKIVWPEEPTTLWQQCYDENTQHCYYWNITSNEVTWEIPPEFTQYLLLYREYEEKVAKLKKEGKSKPKKKKSQKKSEKNKAKQSGAESETTSKDSSAEPQVEYGPHLPPSSNNQKDSSSSPDTGPTPAGQESSKESTPPIYGPMMKPETTPDGIKEIGEESDASNSSTTCKNTHNSARDQNEEDEDDNITDNQKSASVTEAGSPVDSTATGTIGPNSGDGSSAADSVTADLAMIELCKKKFKARMNREEDSGKSSLSADSAAAKDSSHPTDIEGTVLDIDEVDRELELALERKRCELKSLEEEEEKQSHENVKSRGKRKHRDRGSDDSSADEVSTQKSSKRSREQRSRDRKESSKHSKKSKHKKDDTNGLSSDDSNPPSKKSRSDQKKSHRSHNSKKESRSKKAKDRESKSRSCDDEESKLKESALDLSQLLMDKMDFLEIDVTKQSKLQVSCIQLKTRISDWHAGGLSTKYFYVKLQEGNQQLGQYEKSGAPAGWSVNWDRPCKRYFYTNNSTGQSQWEYPEPASKEEGSEHSDNLGLGAGSLPIHLLPPPPPPSSSPPATEKEASDDADKEHQKSAKESERRRDRSSSEKEKYSSSKSEGRKEKRRKESKSSKRSKDSSKSKSHSENSSCSKLKDYDCEMSVYPGEPPPPGTETDIQPSASVSSTSISQTNSPQQDNKDPITLSPSIAEDLEDVMNLAASLGEPTTEKPSAPQATDEIDDMEIDPEEEIATPTHSSADFKTNPTNAGSNGTVVSVVDPVGNHNDNSGAVISKPPHITRPAVVAESLSVPATASGQESGRTEPSVNDTTGTSHIAFSSLPDLSNELSNSPKPPDNHETPEPVKKERRKKKDKVITGTSLTLKKKNVSSLVQKWQKVKKEVEKEDELARHEFSDAD